MSTTLELARELGTSDRTLRRAAARGTLRGRRPTPNRLEISGQERDWIRAHWPLISDLLSALRTEPSVRAAVLFGSTARGDERPDSDVDLLVALASDEAERVADVERRLERRLARPVQAVPLEHAVRDPELMLEILRDGRPLVDRGEIWSTLTAKTDAYRRRAIESRRRRADAAAAAWQELFGQSP